MTNYTDHLNIRYVRLHITAEMIGDTELTTSKASALRGGMGEMLLRMNCIRDRRCEQCDFEPECIVQRTMYSRFDAGRPAFITQRDSFGYVLDCEDYRRRFRRGDTLSFSLTLFGKTIVYFNQFMQAFYALGMNGLGKHAGRFRILRVTNTVGEDILDDRGNMFMGRYQVGRVSDYVGYRLKALSEESGGQTGLPDRLIMKFQTPHAIKYQGEMLEHFEIRPLAEAVLRRIYIMDCFENRGLPALPAEELVLPELQELECRQISVPRYSTRTEQKMYLRGIEGSALLTGVNEDMLKLLLAGEVLHIGKNTSFGFGRYILKFRQ